MRHVLVGAFTIALLGACSGQSTVPIGASTSKPTLTPQLVAVGTVPVCDVVPAARVTALPGMVKIEHTQESLPGLCNYITGDQSMLGIGIYADRQDIGGVGADSFVISGVGRASWYKTRMQLNVVIAPKRTLIIVFPTPQPYATRAQAVTLAHELVTVARSAKPRSTRG